MSRTSLVVALIVSLTAPLGVSAADNTSLVAVRYVVFDAEQEDLLSLRYSQQLGKLVLETEYLRQNREDLSALQQGELGLGWRLGSKTLALTPLVSTAINTQEQSWIVPTIWLTGGARWWEITLRARQFVAIRDETPDRTLIKPARVSLKPIEWLSVGVSVTVAHPEGKPWTRQVGPSLGIKTGAAAIYLQHYSHEETELSLAVRF